MLLSTVAIVLTFGLVIFLHESGHFILCRLLGVRVERFAFGFGPELFGFTRGDTRYSVCAVPLGGFVKPAGEAPEESEGKKDEYFGKPWNQRLAIVAAGPGMNYVLAWALFAGVLLWKGRPVPSLDAVVGDMARGYPAEQAGLALGDRVLSVDGEPVEGWEAMAAKIHARGGKETELQLRRGSEELKVRLTPREEQGKGLIGIAPDVAYESVGFLEALKDGAGQCWFWTRFTVETLGSKLVRLEKPDLAGPVGIMQMIGKAAHSGLEHFLSLVALISVAVGFFNLLPIPLLDGGHAVLFLYEGFTRRKLDSRTLSIANSIGLGFLLFVLAFATVQDIARLRSGRGPGEELPAAEEPAPPAPAPVPAK